MKIRGFLAVLLLTLVIAYFIFFAKTGGKSNIKAEVDRFARTKIELTKINMATLEGIIAGFAATAGRPPADVDELRRTQPGAAAFQDAWGRKLRYERFSDSEFRLTSAGPDGEFGTDDDIVRE